MHAVGMVQIPPQLLPEIAYRKEGRADLVRVGVRVRVGVGVRIRVRVRVRVRVKVRVWVWVEGRARIRAWVSAALHLAALPQVPGHPIAWLANVAKYKKSLCYKLQPLVHTVTACTTYGYNLHHVRLQPLSHTVTASAMRGPWPLMGVITR